VAQQAAEGLTATNRANVGVVGYFGRTRRRRRERSIAETLMRAVVVAEVDVSSEDVIEVRAAEAQEVTQAFTTRVSRRASNASHSKKNTANGQRSMTTGLRTATIISAAMTNDRHFGPPPTTLQSGAPTALEAC
jgi:hypothetical protein